ncbi:hypothetical protein [Halobellus rufus]|uniref:hypothetical protein n=1 Tax=Halobellus rufus TaxID=1448860 RepID=UPI0012E06829|nr:hypothetical protein [Halobellus rufus]
MAHRVPAFLLVLLVVLSIAIVPFGGAAQQYSIAASDSTDTEERTVTVDGTDYQVGSVGTVPVDGSLSVDVEAPEDTPVQVNLYNSDRDIVEFKEQSGSGDVTFEMDGLTPGSYVLVLQNEDDGAIESIQPVVVAGWDVSLSASTNAENEIGQGETLSVTVSSEEHESMPSPEAVEVVFTRDDEVVSRTDAESTGDGEYEATLDSDRDTGSYQVYANVRNTTMVEDRHEVVGVSDSHPIEIVTDAETTEESGSNGQGPSQGSGGGQTGPESTTTETPSTSTVTPETTTTTSTDTTDSETPTDSETNATTTTSTSTESSVITASSETSPEDSTENATPGFGFLAAMLGVVGFVLLFQRR